MTKNINTPQLLNRPSRRLRLWLTWITALGMLTFNFGIANAATLTSASTALSNPQPSATSNYTVTASNVTSTLIKCIKEVYATTATGSTVPTGFSSTSATITAASSTYVNSSASGWTLGVATNGTITYTNASGITPGTLSGATYIAAGITNSSVANTTYFLQFSTYSNTDCATGPVDSATMAFTNTPGSTLTLTVDPTLSFTVNASSSGTTCNSGTTSTQTSTATTIPFGSVTSASNGIVCQSLSIATNAPNGYTVYVRYTGKPTSGANQIADSSGTNGSPAAFSAAGTEAYGYTTNDFALNIANGAVNRFQSNLWAAMTTTNAEISYSSTGVTAKTVLVGHQVGISGVTKPGTYTTTIIYTCTPVY